jgi:hypothetical protein
MGWGMMAQVSCEDPFSLAEYLLGEEGGEWVWLLAPLAAG